MTGSGKTTLARYLLSYRPKVIIYDTKGMITWPEYQKANSLSALEMADHSHIVYVPSLQDSLDNEAIENFFQYIYYQHNTTLYVDEIGYTCHDGKIPFWLQGILSRGRERGVTFYGGTQRPKRIPLSVLSEAEHWYCFRLNLIDDAKRIEQTFGINADEIKVLPKHKFFYGSVGYTHPKPLTLNLE